MSNLLSMELNYKIVSVELNDTNLIRQFIEGINNCKAVITDSFHASIFSIIFNKPFVTFLNGFGGDERLISLSETFSLGNRIQKNKNNKK